MTLHERLAEVADEFFGDSISPLVKKALVDQLEQGVKLWILDIADEVRTNG